ncbi:hypothetical protein [Actinoplanes sp. NPDC023714]|uniref:hypothetical protein n=1 Tax=Actinoplanes sp. NPDC023714 TaxID=3154322 RepID=UPI0033FD090D
MPLRLAPVSLAAAGLVLLLASCAQPVPSEESAKPTAGDASGKAGDASGKAGDPSGKPVGAPGSLDELVAADPERFVGLTADPDGTLVIALAAGTDERQSVASLRDALDGRKYRTVTCATSRAELEKVLADVRATDLKASGYAIAIDPALCSVKLEGNIPAGVVASLKSRFGLSLVIRSGPGASRAQG